jgi:nucleoside phosphorylase
MSDGAPHQRQEAAARPGDGTPEPGPVVILAPMNLEYRAMRARLTGLRREWRDGTAFEIGQVPGAAWPVALMVTGEGNLNAAIMAYQAITQLRARALLIVGVAGALKEDVELGDVVVATWVYWYHGGKEDGDGFRARPRTWPAAHSLEQAARVADLTDTWSPSLADGTKPAVHFKPVAVGEVVLNSRDSPLAAQLRQNYGDAAAIEMESAGAAAAAHLSESVPVLTIRGISDKADGDKQLSDAAGLQPAAAEHAAAFAASVLSVLAPGSEETAEPFDGARAANLPTAWHDRTGAPRVLGAAILELHLVPAGDSPPPSARLLAAASESLIAVGREEGVFGPDEQVALRGPAMALAAAGGLALAGDGQRSAWMPLPSDNVGAVLDPADVKARLAVMLRALLGIEAPRPAEAGLAVGVAPSILVSEGKVVAMPRTLTRERTSLTPVRVPVTSVLPLARVAASPDLVAEELSARLLLAFREQVAPARDRGRPA